jgi:aspartate/methionine/tyrosine aminotransferase
MREHGTAVGPGRFFDAPAHFRIGYGGDTEKIRGGLDRLGRLLAAAHG